MSDTQFNLLVKFLGSTVIICAVGGLVLTGLGKSTPDAIIGLGAAALAALSAAFIRPPERRQVVEVDQPPGRPVPVDPGD